jgi:predicted DNA-binding transcriptional regulator
MKNHKPDAQLFWKQLEDDLVPRLGLNLAERVVYAHLVRHSRLDRKRQLRFSILWLAHGVRVSQPTARQAVRSLAAKGAVRLVDRTLAGHEVEVFLPEEILAAPHEEAVPPCVARPRGATLEEMNFLKVSSRREAIHARERGLCFYCRRRFVTRGRVLDHVVPLARGGSSSYRNLVSCCVECNSQKGETGAEDFLRTLYRLRRLTSAELDARLRALQALAAGKLRPILLPPAVVISTQTSHSSS